ncbi:MAG: aldehyde dehydrogenase family protein [Pseudomonadales bacterium]
MALLERSQNEQGEVLFTLKHPGTLADIGKFTAANADMVKDATAKAHKAQKSWGALSFAARAVYINKLKIAILDRMDDVVAVICKETGKPEAEALAEIAAACDSMQYYAKHAEKTLKEKSSRVHLMFPFKKLITTYHPKGVVGVITPWNFPFSMGANPLAQALMAGNTVILKPSEVTPFSALILAELCVEAGLPEGVFQVVLGDGVTGAALIDSGVNKIHFTGSVKTGRIVGEACGKRLIPCTLELGGKDPAIVCADADLDRAVPGVINSAFFNAGQACASTERVYVMESIADDFIRRVVEEVDRLRQDDKGEIDVSCMIWDNQLRIVEHQVAEAIEQGATLLAGGKRKENAEGLFYQPTVLTDVHHNMAIMQDETFGPVLPIMRVADEEEALRLANQTSYGLSGSIWTGDTQHGLDLARRLHTGCAAVNDFGGLCYGAAEGSFGGRGDSGIGYVNGELGLTSFCQIQHIIVHRFGPKREQMWYPYDAKSNEGMKKFFNFFFRSWIGKFMT